MGMRTPLVLLVIGMTCGLSAQKPPAPAPATFEVASIKLTTEPADVSGLRRLPGGRLEVTSMPLDMLIRLAYQLQPGELIGGPSWLKSDRWNILARMDGDAPPAPLGEPDALMLALRVVLADRFKLALRQDTQPTDVYLLTNIGVDRPGRGLRPSTFDCLGYQQARDAAARGGPPAVDPNTPDRVVCGIRNSGRRLQFGGSPMTMVASMLAIITERRVVDRTGLTGNWAFDISFARPQSDPAGSGLPTEDAPSIFTVLQEELALTLEPARVPMPVMVVDRVERPVED
jgi:uncharacterized protein (TIGR03435 family)